MPEIYTEILRKDHVEWEGNHPRESLSQTPVRVQITVLGPVPPIPDAESGKKLAMLFHRLSALGGVSSIQDPVAWQRELRRERRLPGRA